MTTSPRYTYDATANAYYFTVSDAPVRAQDIRSGVTVIFDRDEDGNVVAVEVLL